MGTIARRLRRRLRALFRKDELERELEDELAFHLEREIAQHVARGLDPAAARREALRSFGGVEQTKEQARDVRGVRLLEDLAADLRYGLRMMRKAPAFTAVAALSLALGVGANTTLFSVVDSVLLRPLAVAAPDQLVLFEWEAGQAFRTGGITGYGVRGKFAPGRRGSSSFHARIYQQLGQQGGPLSDLTAWSSLGNVDVAVDGEAEVSEGALVAGNYFQLLGVPAWRGRSLTRQDDDPAADPAVMISHRYWQTRFQGAADVLGRRIRINRVAFTVVGITPPDFFGTLQITQRPAVFAPLAFEPRLKEVSSPSRGDWWLHLMGRLAPGATREQARASLEPVFRSLALSLMPPARGAERTTLAARDQPRLIALPGNRGLIEHRQLLAGPLYLLYGVVALVLLIACANVANMLLARATARRAEITLRLSLGAGRARLLRQLLTESLLLAGLGGALGLLLALAGKQALQAVATDLPPELAGLLDGRVSWRVFGYTGAVALLAGVLFGLAPALHATRPDLAGALKEGTRLTAGVSRSRLSKLLVIGQVGLSTLLLLAAGLFVRTARNLGAVDVGFDQDRLLVFSLNPGRLGYQGERLEQLYQQVFARLEAIPGVQAVTFSRLKLIAGSQSTAAIHILEPGGSPRRGDVNQHIVRENFFQALAIPLQRGRGFTDGDREGAPKVVIVNEELVRRYFGGRDPVGRRLGWRAADASELTVIGVARDAKYSSQREPIAPLVYAPWRQEWKNIGGMSFAVRTAGDPLALTAAVRQAVLGVDPGLAIGAVTTQLARSRNTFGAERLVADLLTAFGLLALGLAAVGLGGLMAYSVAQRTGEIGIRMALGAGIHRIVRLVMMQGLALAAVGLLGGALAALALGQVIGSQLYGVSGADPLTFAVVVCVLLAAVLLACWAPARRATRVDPVVALRSE